MKYEKKNSPQSYLVNLFCLNCLNGTEKRRCDNQT